MEAIFPPKRRLTLSGLHGVISQKMVLFTCTSVKSEGRHITSFESNELFNILKICQKLKNKILPSFYHTQELALFILGKKMDFIYLKCDNQKML
jgi:hypothetical protein